MTGDGDHELTDDDRRILKYVADAAREEMPTRRDALKYGALGFAAAGMGSAATGAAMGADTSVGDVGTASSPVDIFIDEIRDPGSGSVVVDIDDTGALIWQRDVDFPSVTTDQATIGGTRFNNHASQHQDGGADELDAAELAGGLGTDGQVLTSTGAAAQWEAGGGGGNVPNWQEDGNSPFTATDATSITATLSSSYDFTMWFVEVADTSTNFEDLGVRINGDTGANYDYTTWSGASTTGADRWDDLGGISGGETEYFRVTIPGRYTGAVNMMVQDASSAIKNTVARGVNSTTTSPLDSVTFIRGENADWTVKGYGVSL